MYVEFRTCLKPGADLVLATLDVALPTPFVAIFQRGDAGISDEEQ